MHNAGVGDTRDMARCCHTAPEVPDHLVRIGELINEETATVFAREDAGVTPALTGDSVGIFFITRSDVENVNNEKVAGLGAFNTERSAEDVDTRERGITYIIGRVIVSNSAVKPLTAVCPENVPGLDRDIGWDIRVPAVMPDVLLIGKGFRVIEREKIFRHIYSYTRLVDEVTT
jgi:hypothetical protein